MEIGPGFGQYLVKAILNCNFHDYSACDVSKTSVEGTNRFLNYRNLAEKCTVQEKNFFEYTSDEKFDCIVMGEVLEHVEEPMQMLRKINDLLEESGKAFITTGSSQNISTFLYDWSIYNPISINPSCTFPCIHDCHKPAYLPLQTWNIDTFHAV